MNVLAIYAVNQHIDDLFFAAEQERIARAMPRKPSAVKRAFASIKASIAGRSAAPAPASAPAGS